MRLCVSVFGFTDVTWCILTFFRMMVDIGCTANLIRIISDLWNAAASSNAELEQQESVLADCLNAVMNLSTDVDNQVRRLRMAHVVRLRSLVWLQHGCVDVYCVASSARNRAEGLRAVD